VQFLYKFKLAIRDSSTKKLYYTVWFVVFYEID